MPKRSRNRMAGLGVRTKKGRYIRKNIVKNTNSNDSKNSGTSVNVIPEDVNEVSEKVITTSDLILDDSEDEQTTHNDD